MSFQINQDSAVVVAFAKSKVIDAQYLQGYAAAGSINPSNRLIEPLQRPPALSQWTVPLYQSHGLSRPWGGHFRQALGEDTTPNSSDHGQF